MQFNITSSLGVCLSEKGFSLDELIYRLDDLFKNKAFPEIMAGIPMTFDEWLKVLVMKKARLPFSCGCGGDEVALCGTYARSFHSQLGAVRLPALTRVRCPFCGRRFVPLLEMAGFEKCQTKTAGAEKAVCLPPAPVLAELPVPGQQTVRVLALVARRLAHLVEDALPLGAVRLGVRPALRADVLVCSHS